jgi:hypothetical protein
MWNCFEALMLGTQFGGLALGTRSMGLTIRRVALGDSLWGNHFGGLALGDTQSRFGEITL